MCLRQSGKSSQESHTYRMEEEEFAKRTRRLNEHLQIVGSRCKDPEAKEHMPVFSPRNRCPGVSVRLILQLG